MKPYKVLLFIVCVMACLAGLCFVLPGRFALGDKELRWPTLAQVLGGEEPVFTEIPDTLDLPKIAAIDTVIPIDTIIPEKPKVVIPKVAVDSVTDSRMFLQAFYDALAESSDKSVRVLHYGDSQIEEDRMTQQIREALQKRYGGSGAGLLPLAQTIPSRTVRQELRMNERTITPQQGPRRYMVYGSKRDQRQDGM